MQFGALWRTHNAQIKCASLFTHHLTLSVALGCVGIAVDGDGGAVGSWPTFDVVRIAIVVVVEMRPGQCAIVVKVCLEQEVVALLR